MGGHQFEAGQCPPRPGTLCRALSPPHYTTRSPTPAPSDHTPSCSEPCLSPSSLKGGARQLSSPWGPGRLIASPAPASAIPEQRAVVHAKKLLLPLEVVGSVDGYEAGPAFCRAAHQQPAFVQPAVAQVFCQLLLPGCVRWAGVRELPSPRQRAPNAMPTQYEEGRGTARGFSGPGGLLRGSGQAREHLGQLHPEPVAVAQLLAGGAHAGAAPELDAIAGCAEGP